MDAKKIIKDLGLKPLPREGGFYRETYRSDQKITAAALPDIYSTDKNISTAIYYLLTPDTFSALHRLPSDEIFHFYLGDPVTMLQLYQAGDGKLITLGRELDQGQCVQCVVPQGVWQGAFLKEGGAFALLGVTMAPGFDFADLELADGNDLVEQYAEYARLIERLTNS